MILTERKFQIAQVRDFLRIFDCALVALEQRLHLRFAAEVEILRLIAHPVLIVQRLAGLDAQQHIVGLRVLLAEIVGIIGADHGNPGFLMDFQNRLVYQLLIPDTVVLKLQIKVLRAKQLRHLKGVCLGVIIFAVAETAGNLTCQTGGQSDQALGMLPQQPLIDSRLDIKALRPSQRHHVGKVPIPLLVFAQQNKMPAFAVELMYLVKPGTPLRGNIDLAANDGLDTRRLTGAVKVDHAVHHAVIRNGAGSLPHGLDDFGQFLDLAEAIQQAELRMNV